MTVRRVILELYVESDEPIDLDDMVMGMIEGLPDEWFERLHEEDFVLTGEWKARYAPGPGAEATG